MDEWSDSACHEYCSVSSRYMMENLKFGVIFLGYYSVENNKAHIITDVIIKVISEFEDTINLKKRSIDQTYD